MKETSRVEATNYHRQPSSWLVRNQAASSFMIQNRLRILAK